MKVMKTMILTVLSVLSVTFLSCGSGENADTPEAATKKFVEAFYKADFDELYKITVKSNRPIIQQIQKYMNGQQEKLHQMRKNEIEFKEVKCEMQNDTVAECKCHFLYNKEDRNGSYNLRKEDGVWRVDLTINY